MPAKRKPKKEEDSSSSSSSDSDSDSDSSSSSDAAPRPKSKASSKNKAKEEASTERSLEKKDGDDGKDGEKKVFDPPPRLVFTPHDKEPEMTCAAKIEYCPIDGLPPDFCIYGPSWEKSKPWCMENYPQYYPELCGDSLDDAKKKAAEAAEKAKTKEKPGGKKKRDASPEVTIKKLTRGGRKCVTSVHGLELFGVKLDDAAKKFKKKFSCGVAVVKQDVGGDTVDIQGPFEFEVAELIVAEYKIPEKKITRLDDGVKRKGKG